MKRLMLSDLERFNVLDARSGRVVKGHDQEWYPSWWRRVAGCGPTTASNIVRYQELGLLGEGCWERADAVRLMNAIWKHLTPRKGGVSSAGMFREGAEGYAAAMGARLRAECLDVPEARPLRPSPETVVKFVAAGLGEDRPIAFLNLHNGSELQLDRWHWVTIVAMEHEDDFSAAQVDVLDNCRFIRLSLTGWLATTARGGGFVGLSFSGFPPMPPCP
ncbi:MAG: hypothetical protein LBS32_04155 [Clostridiales Family XIII bacterium]|jgi:hypothetical protein|nr:hypothetical protein [Clostridiales Family XIII bacterium]